jgi:hypothetical protein
MISAEELDAMHDAGVDMSPYMDYSKATRPGRAVQRVNVDFPVDLLRDIDAEADRIGVTRQAFIKMRLSDALLLRAGQAPRLDEPRIATDAEVSASAKHMVRKHRESLKRLAKQ